MAILVLVPWTARAESASDTPETTSASQGGDEDFDTVVDQAREAYAAQEYERAIELFLRAYEIQPAPEMIYNVARIYERSGEPYRAVEYYEQFLDLPGTTADVRARVRTNLSALRSEIAAIEAEQQQANQPTATTTSDPTSPTASTTDPDVSVAQPVTNPSRLHIPGWILTGVGVGTLIVGGIVGGLALGSAREFDDENYEQDRLQIRDDAQTRATAADVMFGVGGGIAAVGVILLIVHSIRRNRENRQSAINLTPTVASSSGGLSLSGSF